jgi:prepilin-type processing-associated H-X9-DG protein
LGEQDVDQPKGLPESSLRAPGDMIAIADYITGGPYFMAWVYPRWRVDAQDCRHPQGPNVVFCDGHIESGSSIIKIWVGLGPAGGRPATADQAAASRWNYDHQPHPETWP